MSRQSILRDKIFIVGYCTQTVQPIIFIPTMLTGATVIYHFIAFSLALILPGGHKVSAKQNVLALISPALSSDQYKIQCGDKAIQVEHRETIFE